MPLIQALAMRFTASCCMVRRALVKKSSTFEDSEINIDRIFAELSTRVMLPTPVSAVESAREGAGLSTSLGQPLVEASVRAEAGLEA